MAQRKKRRTQRKRSTSKKQQYPGWLWMLFGLAIGLSVAFAIYVKDTAPARPQTVSVPSAVDDNNESAMPPAASVDPEPEAAEEKEKRFTFYDLLPAAEFVVPENAPAATEDIQPAAIVEPGVYVLQAGSFSTNTDADRRRAELALQGVESHIQRVTVNDREYHRVYVGPTDDLDELNLLRSRLRAAKIDVLRIRLSD